MNTPVSFELDKLLLSKNIDMPVNPTISDVVMWLYEKHGIWVNVTNLSPSHIIWKYQISKKEVGLIHSSEQCPLPPFNYSPKEAYEAAIIYTLNNLI